MKALSVLGSDISSSFDCAASSPDPVMPLPSRSTSLDLMGPLLEAFDPAVDQMRFVSIVFSILAGD